MSNREHILKIYDRPLLSFVFDETVFGEPTASLDWFDEMSLHLLPMELRRGAVLDGERLYNWLAARAIPQNRANAKKICAALGVAPNDVQGLIGVCKGLSLNDSYWIADESCGQSWHDINLYENGFSDALGALAVSGHGRSLDGLTPSSPELTTGGSLPKAWRIVDGQRILYKGHSKDASPDAGEQFSEYFASQIANRMGLDSVSYGLDDWDDVFCSTSRSSQTPTSHTSQSPERTIRGRTLRAWQRFSKTWDRRASSILSACSSSML